VAKHGERPTIDLAAGRAALAEDLPRVLQFLGARAPEELGWRKPDARSLLVPIRGTHGGQREEYLLRLQFLTGRDWPPSAQFVNPDTLNYTSPDDYHHLPILNSPEVQVHTTYSAPHGGTVQLICCSATFEYYDVLHGGEDRHLWRSSDNFNLTISAIQRAMGSHYQGRQARCVV
jgi:hypothetical protein